MNEQNGRDKVPDISEDELNTNQQLRDIYHSPTAGYRGVNDLYKRAKEQGIDVS